MDEITLIAALAENGVIGSTCGGVPWGRLPRDVKHFRNYTRGKHLLIGRRTFLEMKGWFSDDQTPIVLTSSRSHVIAPLQVNTVKEAINIARKNGASELVVCGGGLVYETSMPFATRLLLSYIDGEFPGDVKFPHFDREKDWDLVSEERWPADSENHSSVTLREFKKK